MFSKWKNMLHFTERSVYVLDSFQCFLEFQIDSFIKEFIEEDCLFRCFILDWEFASHQMFFHTQ